jgi:hypothetical protein
MPAHLAHADQRRMEQLYQDTLTVLSAPPTMPLAQLPRISVQPLAARPLPPLPPGVDAARLSQLAAAGELTPPCCTRARTLALCSAAPWPCVLLCQVDSLPWTQHSLPWTPC